MSAPARLRALIVDDEALARERIRKLLSEDAPHIEVVAELGDGRSALEALTSSSIDLVFLDVQMPEMDGFEVLEALHRLDGLVDPGAGASPAVIFVTAYDRYALRAFEVHALDYLLKPFDRARFRHTLARITTDLAAGRAGEHRRRLVALAAAQGAARPRFLVKARGRVHFVALEDVDWIESAGNYVSLHAGDKTHLVRETMARIEERLRPHGFARIHRSAIVRLESVRLVRPGARGDYEVRLASGAKVPLSRRYYRDLRETLRAGGVLGR